MFHAMTETVAQSQMNVKMVNVKESVLHAIVIANLAMEVAAVYTLGMDMLRANVLVRWQVGWQ